MSASGLPKVFVWTKIQAEAGQAVDQILNRKELERQSGSTFWWGIGESKAEKIMLLVERDSRPTVLFSLMPSSPHQRDSNPDGVLLWEAYETARGRQPLPPHAIVTSRAHDRKGRPKQRHYALVCENPSSILRSDREILYAGTLRNFGDGGKPVGSSQITAVVERTDGDSTGLSYPITARANLVAPFAVRLAAPKILSAPEKLLLDKESLHGKTADDWIAVAKQLRRCGG